MGLLQLQVCRAAEQSIQPATPAAMLPVVQESTTLVCARPAQMHEAPATECGGRVYGTST